MICNKNTLLNEFYMILWIWNNFLISDDFPNFVVYSYQCEPIRKKREKKRIHKVKSLRKFILWFEKFDPIKQITFWKWDFCCFFRKWIWFYLQYTLGYTHYWSHVFSIRPFLCRLCYGHQHQYFYENIQFMTTNIPYRITNAAVSALGDNKTHFTTCAFE